eukprot:211022_1
MKKIKKSYTIKSKSRKKTSIKNMSAQQVSKWKELIEKTLDKMTKETINVNEYLDELKIKYTTDDEKYEINTNKNHKQISLLVNIHSQFLCDKGHSMWGEIIKGKCIGCGILTDKNKQCVACMKYDETYNISQFDKTGNKYLWCKKCMTKTNKENIKKGIQKTDLLIAEVTKILNENPEINIDLLCQLKGKTSLEYLLKDICIDKRIEKYSLYTFDVDGFKAINEQKGHDGADNILKQIGKILNDMEKNVKREWKIRRLWAFRQGGDEFSIVTDKGDNGISLQECVYLYLKNEINKLGITISVGMCCGGLGGYRNVNDLDTVSKWLNYADKHALYAAKKSGKNTIRIWDNKQQKIVNGFKDY